MTELMTEHRTGTREEWLAAREELLVREKEHTRLGDEIAQRRRELPWVRLEKDYRLDTDDGEKPRSKLKSLCALEAQGRLQPIRCL